MAIERSTTGKVFREIGRVKGVGTTNEPQSYQLLDEQPLIGTSYYRIRQVDFDGTEDISEVIKVDFKGNEVLSLYPTVQTTGELTVDLSELPHVETPIEILNANGKLIKIYTVTAGNRVTISTVDLIPGLYFAKVKNGQQILTNRFIKS